LEFTSVDNFKIKAPLSLMQETKAHNLCGTTLVPPVGGTQKAVSGIPGAAYWLTFGARLGGDTAFFCLLPRTDRQFSENRGKSDVSSS